MRNHHIIISSADFHRLSRLIDSARLDRRVATENLFSLEGELARATIVDAANVPRSVIAMNSTVWFRDLDTEEIERYTLVYPPDADVVHHRISILAPIGTALLGYRLGDIIEWPVPLGRRRLQITKVKHDRAACEAEPALMVA